jgi:two-component system phosphate regulon sensor histidine kinase PhoR
MWWRRRLFWKLTLTFSLTIVVCMAVVGTVLVPGQVRTTRRQVEEQLARLARLADESFAAYLDPAHAAAADSLAKVLGADTGTRITIIAPDGVVLADTQGTPARMENHRFRPEVQAALNGEVGSNMRTSATVHQRFLYVAVPSRARQGWVIRVALPYVQFERHVRESTNVLALGVVLAVVLILPVGALFTRRITHPLEAMRASLRRLEQNEFGVRLDPGADDEIGQLARTLNQAQERLEHTIRSLTGQRNQREAIVASMVEGLVAVDGEGSVLLINASARALLDLDQQPVEGRALVESVRQPDFIDFVREVQGSTGPLGRELVLRGTQLRWLELHGAPLRFGAGEASGAVVVFNDVTRVHRLEQTRKDFVANVSHELKTPVTSIKGFLETLVQGGALEDPVQARRFLGIIARQTDRLTAIIDDLLYLSRLEHEGEGIPRHPVNLAQVVEGCIADFQDAAQVRGVTLAAQADAGPHRIAGDASLLTRAIDNLLDNAIKYSPAKSRVDVALRREANVVLFEVRDQGIGIPEEHLPRITERFYRVDTARSREMGGTGLGLAIVKHVALVHRGTLRVESRLGRGSCFTLRFPADSGTPEGA